MSNLVINEFLQEKKLRTRTDSNKRRYWSREEDKFLLDTINIIPINEIADFFETSVKAVESRIVRVKKKVVTYSKISPLSKAKAEMQSFLNKYKEKKNDSIIPIENKSGYEIVSAKALTITSGEVKFKGYTIRGSFTILVEDFE